MGLVIGTDLEVKDDKEKDAIKNKDDNKKNNGKSPAIVLKLDLHCDCEGCARKVKNSIRHFEGVESVNVDMAGNTITVTGAVDPTRIKERIEKKTRTKVEIVSPQVSAPSDKKPKEVQSRTVVLEIPLHCPCQGCMDRIRRTVSKFKGVESAIQDASKDLVLVKGTMNVNELVSHLKQKFKREVDVVLPNKDVKSDEKKEVKKEVEFEGVDKKEKGNNGGDGMKKKKKNKKKGDIDKTKDEMKADASKSIKLKGVDNKEKRNNGGDGEKKKDGDKDLKKNEVRADASQSVEFNGVDKKEKGNTGGDGDKMKDSDKNIKKDEMKADASKSVEVVNKLKYYGQNPFAYTMPMYNQSYYNQDYGISTSNHVYDNMRYANHGYAMQYSNGPPPPPPMYMHDSRGRDAGMFSDENPNAACSII